MKCGSFVLWVTARRKGSGNSYERVKETVSWWGTRDLGIRADPGAKTSAEYLAEGYVRCDGNIVASVCAVDEPDWGHSYAKLEVGYKCDKCGQEFFPELPTEPESLSALLTKSIDEIRENVGEASRRTYRDNRIAEDRRLAEASEEIRARWAARKRGSC